MPLIELDNLSKSFAGTPALTDLSLALDTGEITTSFVTPTKVGVQLRAPKGEAGFRLSPE